MTNETHLPLALLAAGAVPDVCPRHGAPAAHRRKVAFISKPPAWTYVIMVFGILPGYIAMEMVRRTATVAGWPECERCATIRREGQLTGWGLTGGCIVAFLGAFVLATGGDSDDGILLALMVALMIIAFPLLFAGIVVGARTGSALLARGSVSQDGTALVLARPAPAFTEQIQRLTSVRPVAGTPATAAADPTPGADRPVVS